MKKIKNNLPAMFRITRQARNYKGFSLVESIIGVAIAGGVFVVFLALLPKIIQTESHAQRVIIATNLAQEGIEMVRNLRDNNLKITYTKDNKDKYCGAFETPVYPFEWNCIFTPESDDIVVDFFSNPYFEEYFYVSEKVIEIPENFTRTISVKKDTADANNRKITSTVNYNGIEMAKIETILYPWGESQ